MTIFVLSTREAGGVPRRHTETTWESFARELGHNLRRAREATGLSQERVAHAAGLASYTYQKFEKGESRPGMPLNPRLTTLVALSQVLGVPVAELLPADLPDVTSGR
ncbi:helix-turn-helix transcriptional regulator [Nocardioides aquiterrae]|uniref:HTH cro/C1-type domain-containing protein n=1 Tax=Nocardioides aquiterrae TaxID=203799 RepID=A0ABN1USE1_9ACTN